MGAPVRGRKRKLPFLGTRYFFASCSSNVMIRWFCAI